MASREILSLDTATPQIVAPQTGDTYSAPRAVAISPEPLTGTSATTSLDIAQTWNTTGTPTAIKMNVTDTASNAASLLMDLQAGGTSKFSVRKDGRVLLSSINDISGFFGANSNYLYVANSGLVSFSGATNAGTSLREDNTQNTLAQRNATNAQTFNIYNTYSTTTNYERGFLKWNTNVLQIGTEKGSGGGTARALELQTDGTTRLTINTSGNATFSGAVTIGATSVFGHAGRVVFTSPSAGVYTLQNNTQTDWDRLQFGGTTSSFPALKRVSANLQVIAADNAGSAGLIVGNQALATTATDGFLYVPTCAGTPTGTPTAQTGTVPIVVDTTNNKLYFYSGAAWRDAGP